MNSIIQQMLSKYELTTVYDKKNAIKEVMQEIVLCGLSRAGFFKKAAFYGGTALRIFYGLDRFSEDLDFSLMYPDDEFELASYFPILEKEIKSFGLNVEISQKVKTKESGIDSAFLKGNTRELFLSFYANEKIGIPSNELIKIKFEVDINPPALASFENKYNLLPIPHEVKLYDMPSLFAGKIHAVICRAWNTRVKGRDLYDYVFYLSRRTGVNVEHLTERLKESGYIDKQTTCEIDDIKKMLCERFDNIDFNQAKKDVEPFIKNPSVLDVWSKDFFKQITENLYAK